MNIEIQIGACGEEFGKLNTYEPITREELLELERQCHNMGLVANVYMIAGGDAEICDCSAPTCAPFLANEAIGSHTAVVRKGTFVARTDRERCQLSGDCTKVCHLGARFPDEPMFSRSPDSPWAVEVDGSCVEAGVHFGALIARDANRSGRRQVWTKPPPTSSSHPRAALGTGARAILAPSEIAPTIDSAAVLEMLDNGSCMGPTSSSYCCCVPAVGSASSGQRRNDPAGREASCRSTWSWGRCCLPFDRPYKDEILPGDLVYGLSGERNPALPKDCLEQYYSIDIINNTFLGTNCGRKATRLYQGDQTCGVRPAMVGVVDSFRDFLEHHAKYSPLQVQERCWRDLRVKRACKGGIEWVIRGLYPTDRNANPNPTVHFVLGGLNMEEVVHKSHALDKTTVVNGRTVVTHSITGSEIRWIYRHRNDPTVRARVQFRCGRAMNYRTCEPPWQTPEGAVLWSQYHPKSESPST